jgi:hypothetical protein
MGFDWGWLLRIFLLGPCTGACVGFAQTTAAVLCWVRHGEPDFYFRGWPGVHAHYYLLTSGGAIVGILYGIALWAFEQFSRRRVRVWVTIPSIVVVAFGVAALVAEHEFREQRIDAVLLPESMAIGFGLLLCTTTARRVIRSAGDG